MYASHFGLKREPFSIAPDPRYLFMSERHREALAHLLYGVGGGGGFVLLTGEIGAGKTTVCRAFLEQIPKRCNVAYIFNPKLTVVELLQSVCDEFRIPCGHTGPGEPTVKHYLDPLNEYLLRTHAVGQNNVLIIDEAQNLSPDVLEQLRLLTNLETSERKLLQIILIGQPELRDMLAQPQLEQLAQRVIARFHLDALSELETAHYIQHRLSVAGRSQGGLFDRQALHQVHVLTRGVPRRINLLCDRALLGAYALGQSRVGKDLVKQAAQEVFSPGNAASHAVHATPSRAPVGHSPKPWWRRGRVMAALAGAVGVSVMLAVLVGVWAFNRQPASAMSHTLALPASAVSQADAVASIASGASQPVHAGSRPSGSRTVDMAASDLNAAPALSDPDELLQGAWRSDKQAWAQLAPLWQLTVGEGDPCLAVQRQQAQCFRGSGGLALVRQLGRPGILTLYDERGQAAYVLLTGLQAQSATVLWQGRSRTVPLGVLSRVWRGDFASLWRTPPAYRSKVLVGQSGPTIHWLAERMAQVDGLAGPSVRQVFDATLQARVHAFQMAQGLKPDGVVGATTFMLLNRATGVDEPRLLQGK